MQVSKKCMRASPQCCPSAFPHLSAHTSFEKAILLPWFVVFKVLPLHVIPTQPTSFIRGLPSDFPIVLLRVLSPVLRLTSLMGKVIFSHLLIWILFLFNGSWSSKRVLDDKTQQRANSTNRWTTQKWDSSSNYHTSVNNCSIHWTQKLCSLRNAKREYINQLFIYLTLVKSTTPHRWFFLNIAHSDTNRETKSTYYYFHS